MISSALRRSMRLCRRKNVSSRHTRAWRISLAPEISSSARIPMWRARPVFVSSTFQDMHAERDYLRLEVFRDLEERLLARRHHLEWVDLRLGVAAAAVANEADREREILK